ncbi:MAG: hypothetical protein ACRC2S_16305 [Waterburya sp.]
MPKAKKKTKDYYACVTVDIQIYFQAEDDEDAENVADEIAGNLSFDSNVLHDSIDYDGHEIIEINLHD